MRISSRWALACAFTATLALAVQTETWSVASLEDFLRGKADRIAVRSDGRLSLAPAAEELMSPSDAFLWATALDSKGTLYAGGGGIGAEKARVYAVGPDGKSRALTQLDGLQVQALAVDSKDRLFAATGPDGRIYRVAADGAAETFYDPKTKYIWALVFDKAGNLYVATGDQGEIHKVTPDGKGSVFFKTEETHARAMALDAQGNLIVGTEPGGLILRVNPKAEGFVLYQADKREIVAVAVHSDGRVFAAGVGAKQKQGPRPAIIVPPPPKPEPSQGGAAGQQSSGQQNPQQGPPPTSLPIRPSLAGGSEIYQIQPDGFPEMIWKSEQEVVYALAIGKDGRLLAGTGNEGVLYRIDSPSLFTRLWNSSSSQITSLSVAPTGRVYLATGNVGKLYRLGPESATEGTLESDVFDAERFSQWGRIYYRGQTNGGSIALQTRTGNLDRPQQNWSQWSAPIEAKEGGRITSPAARFIQWKLTLKAPQAAASPEIEEITAAYMGRNVAPEIKRVASTPPNYQFPSSSLRVNPTDTITLSPLGQKPAAKPRVASGGTAVAMKFAKGYVGARWLAEDPNGDDLRYSVFIRGVGETSWRPLEKDLETPYVSWDSAAFPDGRYQIKVEASDSPSNPPGTALTATMESDPFLIDNTPPAIDSLTAKLEGGAAVVTWKAEDKLSLLGKAEYSLDGGDWQVVEPETRLTDSPSHSYKLTLKDLTPGEHVIAIRVEDEFLNRAVAKTVLTR